MQDSQENVKKISLRDVLLVLCSKVHVFVGIYACIVITTVLLAFLLPPVYQVTGDILIKPFLEPNVKLFAPVPTNIRANPVMPQDINSEVNILKSPQLLRKVVQQLSLEKPDPPSSWVGSLVENINHSLRGLLVSLGLSVQVSSEDQAIQYLAGVFWGVGAAYEFWAGVTPACPKWLGDLGLNWLYRLFLEPRRLARRYISGNATFLRQVLKEKLAL